MRQFHAHMVRADFLKFVLDDLERQVGAIAFAAQMRQIQMPKIGGHELFGSLSGGFVGEMTVTAKDSLLQTPRAAHAILKHFHVVIGFEHEHVRGAHAVEHEPCDVAKVGRKTDVDAGRAQ